MNILESFYTSKSKVLSNLFDVLKNKGLYNRCSYPQLMALWDNEQIPSLMFIGQEPYGWDGGETVDELMAAYKKFNLGENYNSPFWIWLWRISERLGFKGKHPFLWTNLQKISDVDGGPALDEITEIEHQLFNILSDEIKTLQPRICIFVSGPNYDKYIKNKFKDVEFIPIEDFTDRQFVQVKSPQLPILSFRIYHPGFLNRQQELGERIISRICDFCSLEDKTKTEEYEIQ